MPIDILAVGKMAHPYLEAAKEYEKRLSRYDKVTVTDISEQREPASLSPALIEEVKRREGEQLMRRVSSADYLFALCIDAPQMSSEVFAQRINELRRAGKHIVFAVGGSLGLSSQVEQRADMRLSLSGFTFPHQLARVILLEQIYRAFKIIANERYHK